MREGSNNIDRQSTDSVLFKKEYLTGDKFYKKIVQAIQGKEPVTFTDRMWGFPEHLMLPKGTVDGMRFKLFFYIGPCEETKVMDLPILGKRIWYGKPLGFPLDRPMQPWFFKLENIYLKDVLIYNIGDATSNVRNVNRMMDYDSVMQMKDSNIRRINDLKDIEKMREDVDDLKIRDTDRRRTHDLNMFQF